MVEIPRERMVGIDYGVQRADLTEANVSNQLSDYAFNTAQVLQQKANHYYELEFRNQAAEQINTAYNKNQINPDQFSKETKAIEDGLVKNAPFNLKQDFRAVFRQQTQPYLDKITNNYERKLNDDIKFSTLKRLDLAKQSATTYASGLFSGDKLQASSSSQALQSLISDSVSAMSAVDGRGMPVFSAAERFNVTKSFLNDVAFNSVVAGYDEAVNKEDYINRVASGDLTAQLYLDEQGNFIQRPVRDIMDNEIYNRAISYMQADYKKILQESQELPLKEQIKNQQGLLGMIYNTNVSSAEKLSTIYQMDFQGVISDKFASEAVSYINGTTQAIPEPIKLKSFINLTDDLTELRVKLGGTVKEIGDVKLTQDGLKAFQDYQTKVMTELNAGNITVGESKTLLNGVNDFINAAIEGRKFDENGLEITSTGITEVTTIGLDKINSLLARGNKANNFKLKKDLFLAFNENLGAFDEKGNYQVTGQYKTTGNAAEDKRIINTALNRALRQVNINNYVGIIDSENPPNAVVLPTYNTTEEMEAANLPDGTPVIVGGVYGIARSN